jgi:hypothetical protein
MTNNPKIALGAIAALFAISFIVRFVVLSQAGVSGMWMVYLGVPVGGVVALILLLLRLRLLDSGEKPTAQHVVRPWAAPTAQRLQQIENLHTSGAISDAEYAAKRARIISGI